MFPYVVGFGSPDNLSSRQEWELEAFDWGMVKRLSTWNGDHQSNIQNRDNLIKKWQKPFHYKNIKERPSTILWTFFSRATH
jgi:hypothetical protein